MKNIRTKTKFDFKALKTANLYLLRVKRKSYIVYAILAVICVAAGIYSVLTSEDLGTKIGFGIVFALIAGMSVYNAFSEEKKIDKSLIKFFQNNPAMTQYLSFNDESLAIVVPSNGKLEKVSYDWAYVQEINVLNDYIIMFLNGNFPIIINRNDESMIEGTQEELLNLIKEKGALKPYRVYEKEVIKNFSDPIEYVEEPEVNIEDVIAKFEEVEENNTSELKEMVDEKLPSEEEAKIETLENEAQEEKETIDDVESSDND